MEIKTILDKIRQTEERKKEVLFALQIDPELVKSAIWVVEEGQIKIFAIGETQGWQSGDQLLEAVDTSLSSAVEKFKLQETLPEPNKVVFGLPKNWVDQDKIIPEKGEILNKITKKLELEPVGFVVTIEAISHNLKTVEGIPPTAIIAGLGIRKVTISLLNLGKIIGIQLVERSDNLGADLAEGLSRFNGEEVFPARILLYGNEKLEEARQELINYSWQSGGINFLHLPKVEVLGTDFDIKGIALAGGQEITKTEIKKPLVISEVKKEPEKEPDIKEEILEQEPKKEAELMGFVKGEDIAEKMPLSKEPLPQKLKEEERVPLPVEKRRSLTFPKINLAKIFNFFSNIKEKFPIKKAPSIKLKINFSGRTPLVIGIIAFLILIFAGVSFAFWWYLPKADIVILIKPQILEKDFTIKLDRTLKETDKENLTLPAQEVEATVEKDKTITTTGTKLVGDPAKGEITIYNRTQAEKTFNAGMEITGPSNLKFSLDDQVIVASESAGSDYTRIPGKAKVKVTAIAIGTEGNFAAGTEFSLANYAKSDFIARNEGAFSGGTSREVQVVSKKDQEKLINDLTEELKGKGLEELITKISSDKGLIKESLTGKVIDQNFDKDVGEEAVEVKLKLKIKFTTLSYSEQEFKSLIQEEIQKAVPEGFEYRPEESETSFTLKEVTKSGVAVFSAHLKTYLFPLLDIEGIKQNLSGKKMAIGESYLLSLPNVDSFEAQINPRLPERLVVFPRNSKKIKIEVRVK